MKKTFATLLAGVFLAAMPLTIAGAQAPAKQTGPETGTAKDSTPPRDPQQNAAPAKSAPAPTTSGSSAPTASKEQKKGTETGTAPDTAGPAAIRDVPGAKKN
jgi:hypothetical protein